MCLFEALQACGVWGDALYLAKLERIEVTNLGGVVKSTLPFMDSEGHPTLLAINGTASGAFLAAGTDRGFVKAWDLSTLACLRSCRRSNDFMASYIEFRLGST